MIQKVIIVAVAAIAILAGTSPAYAEREGVLSETTHGATDKLESTTKTVVDDTAKTVSKVEDSVLTQKERVEAHKAELRDKLSQQAAARKEKLEGRRLAQCENRQKHINDLLDKSLANGRLQLDNIQRVQQRVTEFYAKQKLASTDYEAALVKADTAKANALATFDVMGDQTFDCQTVDGAKPSLFIQETHQAKKDALDAYRQSVIELIHVTKQAFETSHQEAENV